MGDERTASGWSCGVGGASVDADAPTYGFIGAGLLGLGSGVFQLMSSAVQMLATHNVAGSSLVVGVTGGSAAQASPPSRSAGLVPA